MTKRSTFTNILRNFKDRLYKAVDDDIDIQNYDISDEDLAGLSVVDEGDTENDEAAKWLEEQEGKSKEAKDKADKPKAKRKSFKDWEPSGEYTPEQEDKIKEYMDQGYSHREAERFVGAHKGPSDFQSALKHNVFPSQMSDKHLDELKGIAGHWLEQKERRDKLEADPEKEPLKHAAGQTIKTHEEMTRDYNDALHDFMQSDEVKDLKGRDRFKAIQKWKNDWHEANPDYHSKLAEADVHQHFREAGSVGGGIAGSTAGAGRSGTMGRTINERLDAIAGVGSADTVSGEEAAQHVGGVKTDAGTQASTVRDPLSSGSIHSKQRELAQKDRMARAADILKQHGTPDQNERFSKLKAAKTIIRRPGKNSGEE